MFFTLRGFLIGLAIAAPVGPIGVLCIRRTLAQGRTIGMLSGLGAATADMSYGLVAALGLTAIQQALVDWQGWLRVLGGIFLLIIGTQTFLAKPTESSGIDRPRLNRLSAYISTLGLTLTNPATILSFAAIFAALRLGETSGDTGSPVALVVGVFLGSATWWLLLSGVVSLFRERVTLRWLTWINRLAGTVIFGFGVAAILLK